MKNVITNLQIETLRVRSEPGKTNGLGCTWSGKSVVLKYDRLLLTNPWRVKSSDIVNLYTMRGIISEVKAIMIP